MLTVITITLPECLIVTICKLLIIILTLYYHRVGRDTQRHHSFQRKLIMRINRCNPILQVSQSLV